MPCQLAPVIGYGNEKGGVERRAEAKFGKFVQLNWGVSTDTVFYFFPSYDF